MSFLITPNKIIGAVVIAGLGILSSLWTNFIFTYTLSSRTDNEYYRRTSDLIFETVQYEYITICFITIITLIWGLTKKDKKYLIPWSCLKICEILTIVVGTIIIYPEHFTGIVPIGIGAVCINAYILYCVYEASIRISIPLPPEHLKKIEKVEKEIKNGDVKIQLEEKKPFNEETDITDKLPKET